MDFKNGFVSFRQARTENLLCWFFPEESASLDTGGLHSLFFVPVHPLNTSVGRLQLLAAAELYRRAIIEAAQKSPEAAKALSDSLLAHRPQRLAI